MKTVVIGLGIQGRKRVAIVGADLAATVDPIVSTAQYQSIEQIPLDSFDAAMVCVPDQEKLEILTYLLSRSKHVLVEKPLLAGDEDQFSRLIGAARSGGATCYTAYNHRFEPHIVRLKELLEEGVLGRVYQAGFFYGNGTAERLLGATRV